MDNRGQTTFEYLLLVGGVVVLGVLVVYLLTSSVKSSAGGLNSQIGSAVGGLNSATNTVVHNIKSAVSK